MSLKDRLGKLTDAVGITESEEPNTVVKSTSPPSSVEVVRSSKVLTAATSNESPNEEFGEIDSVQKSIESDLANKNPEAYVWRYSYSWKAKDRQGCCEYGVSKILFFPLAKCP
jgi:hypothetical protein